MRYLNILLLCEITAYFLWENLSSFLINNEHHRVVSEAVVATEDGL